MMMPDGVMACLASCQFYSIANLHAYASNPTGYTATWHTFTRAGPPEGSSRLWLSVAEFACAHTLTWHTVQHGSLKFVSRKLQLLCFKEKSINFIQTSVKRIRSPACNYIFILFWSKLRGWLCEVEEYGEYPSSTSILKDACGWGRLSFRRLVDVDEPVCSRPTPIKLSKYIRQCGKLALRFCCWTSQVEASSRRVFPVCRNISFHRLQNRILKLKMQIKKQLKSVYQRRANTAPLFSTLPTRFPVKTIKSLNVYCLAEIFEYLNYKDLVACRRVCSFWKEAVDYHLSHRTHFAYGKIYNNLAPNKGAKDRKKSKFYSDMNTILQNSLYTCEKCVAINDRMDKQRMVQQYLSPSQTRECKSPSPESTGSLSSFDDYCCTTSNASSSNMSLTPTNSPAPPQESADHAPFDVNEDPSPVYRCLTCQMLCNELQQQMTLQFDTPSDSDEHKDENEDFFSGYIDEINMDILESILIKMPKLTTLMYGQGKSMRIWRFTTAKCNAFCLHSLDAIMGTCKG